MKLYIEDLGGGEHRLTRNGADGRVAKKEEITAAALAELLADGAESNNYHDLCGAYPWLAQVLWCEAGEAIAASVMLKILKNRGLCGEQS